MEPSATGPSHLILFFQRDEELIEHGRSFVADGLSHGDRMVVIMTPAHIRQLDERLSHAAADCRRDQLVTMDAVALADTLAPAGVFDRSAMTQLFAPFMTDGAPLHSYGELTSVLVERGYVQAALELELTAQQFTHEGGSRIVCAYDLLRLGLHTHDESMRIMRSLHDGCAGH